MRNQVVRFFPNTDLRCGHKGLGILAKKHRINAEDLRQGEYLIFLNRAKDKLKMYASGNIVAYLKMPRRQPVTMEIISNIPNHFNGVSIKKLTLFKKQVQGKLIPMVA